MGRTGTVYYLVAGRWFSAPGFTGPWTFATPSLPADFKKIPLEHPRSRVLASVPGTDRAAEAVLLAQMPQTARVNKKEAEGARRRVPGRARVRADRNDHGAARRQHRQGRLQGRRRSITCATRASGSPGRAPAARGRSPARCPSRSTRSRSARRPITSPTSPSKTTTTSG